MQIQDNRQFDHVMALAHVMDEVGDDTLSNGAPKADALFDALRHDAREAGRGLDAILELDWEQLFDAGFDLSWLLDKGTGEYVLPFGTTVTSSAPGSVKIAGRELVVDADRPGLHPVETTSSAPSGSNLALLHRLISAKTAKLACRRLGLPVASFITDADSRHLLQFPPLAEAGGVRLQRWATGSGAAKFNAAPHAIIEKFADSIVADMRALWKNRVAVRARVEEVREAALAGIAHAEGAGRDISVDRICVDMEFHRDGDAEFSLYLEYAGCDEALRSGRILEYVPGRNELDPNGLWSIPYTHEGRIEELERLRALGANGRIEAMAAAIASIAPEGRNAVLGRLAEDLETQIVIETADAPIYTTLFWRNGVINAEISQANAFELWSNCVWVKPASRTGRGEKQLEENSRVPGYCNLPFDCDAAVTDVNELNDGGIRLKFERSYLLVNVDTGAIWSEPQGLAAAA